MNRDARGSVRHGELAAGIAGDESGGYRGYGPRGVGRRGERVPAHHHGQRNKDFERVIRNALERLVSGKAEWMPNGAESGNGIKAFNASL